MVIIDGPEADAFTEATRAALAGAQPQVMLTDGMAEAYRQGAARVAAGQGVRALLEQDCSGRSALPYLFEVTAEAFLGNHDLAEEVFGPLGLIVRVRDAAQMEEAARAFSGQLTATLQLDDGDADLGWRQIAMRGRCTATCSSLV